MKTPHRPWMNNVIFGVLVYAYFAVFPRDLQALLEPLQIVLQLSKAISPALLALVGVGALGWTAVRLWGPRRKPRA